MVRKMGEDGDVRVQTDVNRMHFKIGQSPALAVASRSNYYYHATNFMLERF